MDQREFLTSGQAAKLCSVTRDTILKWIKQGKFPARRTAGGHYRIRRRDIQHLMVARGNPSVNEEGRLEGRSFQYCWEYNSGSQESLHKCKECVVYRARAFRCYEVIKLGGDIGHAMQFCSKTCDECDYYNQVHLQATNVLVISDNQVLKKTLPEKADEDPINLEITDCAYSCSALVETFRPDYAVVDCSLEGKQSRDIVKYLNDDPRLPYVRVILAARGDELPEGDDGEVLARIRTPFTLDDITDCIDKIRSLETGTEDGGKTS
jgi:excisionase family DNA binding protein